MKYAQVAVDSPLFPYRPYSYSVPDQLSVQPGQEVRVPFGRRVLRGLVLGLSDTPGVPETKEIAEVLSQDPLLSLEQIGLLRWLSWRYRAPLFASASLLLPPGRARLKPRPGARRELSPPGAPQAPLQLTPAQEAALNAISEGLREGKGVYLLHGATGSGKTEVYLRALAEVLARGRRGMVLVPEIALTPQTVERLAARFPGGVALLHSGLRDRERYDTWRGVGAGDYPVVLGTRSAVFAPQPDLGILVLDEEHEWTYKQEETPYYHAREVALEQARREGAVVVLGSATPAVESYFRALRGEYRLLELPQRISPAAFPEAELVDMRQELREGHRSPLGRKLLAALAETLAAGEQAILFLNRKGMSALVQCRRCGQALACPRCALALSYHREGLHCHQCGSRLPTPSACPRCGGAFSFLGLGTQRLEEEVAQAFPRARPLRWDRDTPEPPQAILQKFRDREADILIGTQIVAKGLDIPRVTLVGVVLADVGLHYPDFRGAERTFQMVMQVAGRAGRGAWPGRVILQTYQPEHYALKAALANDYRGFYDQELAFRRQYNYPPFSQLARLLYSYPTPARPQREAESLARRLRQTGVEVLGPAPAFFSRLRGKYRWQILMRGQDLPGLLSSVEIPPGWAVDIDPVHLL